MFRSPRPLGASTAGIRLVGSGSSPGRHLLVGLEDAAARRGQGTEVGNDMSQGDMSLGSYFHVAAAAAAQDASKRPDGKKTEKKKLRHRSTIEALDYLVAKMKEADAQKDLKKNERCNKAFAIQEEKLKLEREKFEFQRELEEERILSLDLNNMTYRLRQYYERRQDEIFARRCGC
ncbi:unnamed protein product [Urochloa humidicola]